MSGPAVGGCGLPEPGRLPPWAAGQPNRHAAWNRGNNRPAARRDDFGVRQRPRLTALLPLVAWKAGALTRHGQDERDRLLSQSGRADVSQAAAAKATSSTGTATALPRRPDRRPTSHSLPPPRDHLCPTQSCRMASGRARQSTNKSERRSGGPSPAAEALKHRCPTAQRRQTPVATVAVRIAMMARPIAPAPGEDRHCHGRTTHSCAPWSLHHHQIPSREKRGGQGV